MEHLEQDMKISAAEIRRLRTERGWSQEQLAAASGLGLRTIQRVEAEGKAARETRVCLAATFNVPLTDLLEVPDADAVVKPVLPVRRYQIALAVAIVTLMPALLGIAGVIETNHWVSVCFMATIALFLYGGFGLYFTGAPRQTSPLKRYVQITFIAAAIFFAFASFAQGNSAAVSVAAQVTTLVLGMYCLFDYLRLRRQVNK